MLRAQSVADFPNRSVGIFVIVELVGAVQCRAVELDVTVDMMPVRMGRNNELMLSLGELHRKLIPQFRCFLRCDLTRLEGLDQQIGNNIFLRLARPSGDGGVYLLTDGKFLPSGISIALIGFHQQTIPRLVWIFIVIQAVFEYLRDAFSLAGVSGFDFCY